MEAKEPFVVCDYEGKEEEIPDELYSSVGDKKIRQQMLKYRFVGAKWAEWFAKHAVHKRTHGMRIFIILQNIELFASEIKYLTHMLTYG